MFRPRNNDFETQTIASLITLQAAFFHQVVAELAKFECTFVVAEALSSCDPKPQKRNARRITIAVLETKIHHAANYEFAEVLVEEHCSIKKFRQDVQNIQDIGIGNLGHVKEVLYLPVPE